MSFILRSKISTFQKLAGILSVPEKILKEVCDFVIASYCFRLENHIDYTLLGLSGRYKEYELLQQKSSEWFSGWSNVVEASSYGGSIHKLVEWCGQTNGRTIPAFSEEADSKTNLQGIVSLNDSSLAIALDKTSKGYDLYLSINHQDVNLLINKQHLTEGQVQNILMDNFDKMDKVKEDFIDFTFKFEPSDQEYQRKLGFLKAICKKKSQNYNQEELKEGRYFKFNTKDIPYLSALNKFLTLFVEFIPNKLRAQNIYDKEEWLGLWFGNKQSADVGSLYVARDVRNDFNQLRDNLNSDYLQVKFAEITDTTRHELQHFIQTGINYSKNLETAGLPSKKLRSKEYDPYGYKKQIISPVQTEVSEEKDKSKELQHHSLRDVEFYTRLSDEVSAFNKYKTYLPLALHNKYIKAWIGAIGKGEMIVETKKYLQQQKYNKGIEIYKQNPYSKEAIHPDTLKSSIRVEDDYYLCRTAIDGALGRDNKFFLDLRSAAPEKYNKAVKEFIKAVS